MWSSSTRRQARSPSRASVAVEFDDVREQDGRQRPLVLLVRGDPEQARAGELDRVEHLVADDPGVVTRRDLVGIPGNDVQLRPVVHQDVEVPGDHIAEMAVHA